MAVSYKPAGYHTVTPYIVVSDALKLIEFMKQAFDAVEMERMMRPDGTIGHVEMRIGDSMIMLGQSAGEWKPMPIGLYLYVPDTDVVYKAALAAGGTSLMEPSDQFYGDRNAGVRDMFGNLWWIATHIEDVPPEEMQRRAAAKDK